MKSLGPVLLAFSLCACASDGVDDGPCSPPTGPWVLSFTERGKRCTGDFENVAVFGLDSDDAEECEGDRLVSANGCDVTLADYGCPTDTGGYLSQSGVLRAIGSTKIEGTMQIDITTPSGDTCFNVYDISGHPL